MAVSKYVFDWTEIGRLDGAQTLFRLFHPSICNHLDDVLMIRSVDLQVAAEDATDLVVFKEVNTFGCVMEGSVARFDPVLGHRRIVFGIREEP